MTWILYSTIMFVTSVVMYMLVRGLQKTGVDNRLVTMAVGALPGPLLAVYVLVSGISVNISLKQLLLLFIVGIFFSFLGNKFSIKGVKSAPNPGYSLIIQKSYAPYSAILAYFIFQSQLTITAFVAIVMIIVSLSQVIIDPAQTKKKSTGYLWLIESFAAFFAFGSLVVMVKYLLNEGVNVFVINMIYFNFAALAFALDNRKIVKEYKSLKLNSKIIAGLLLIGLTNVVFSVSMQSAFKGAPNIGYVNIINSSSITAIALLSALIFKDKLTLQKLLGIVGVTCGLAILFLG